MTLTLFESEFLGWCWSAFLLTAVVYTAVMLLRSLIGSKSLKADADPYKGHVGGYSVLGTREYQQDAMTFCSIETADGQRGYAALVCDGMGGMDHGDLASTYCCGQFETYMKNLPGKTQIPSHLKAMVHDFDRIVSDYRLDGKRIRSGSTLVGVVLLGQQLYTVSIGDSRIYLKNSEGLRCLTRDHNYALRLQEQVQAGQISRQEAAEHPKREALISYIGRGDVSLVDVTQVPVDVNKGDVVLLCSDGVTKLLSDQQIERIINEKKRPARLIAQQIVDQTIAARTGGQDNTTAVVLVC